VLDGSVRFKEAYKRQCNLAGWYNRKRLSPAHPVKFNSSFEGHYCTSDPTL
jgi:hypothetical protein